MRKILAVIALIALTGCATNLPKQEPVAKTPLPKVGAWTEVATSDTGEKYYVDLSTVRLTSLGYRYAKTINTNNGIVFGAEKFVDCRPSPFATRSSIAGLILFKDGKPDLGPDDSISKELRARRTEFKEDVPNSVGEAASRVICSAPLARNYREHFAEFHGTAPLPVVATYANQSTTGGYSGGYSGGCAENGSCYGDTSVRNGRAKTVHVDGYYRRDGTYVRGHYRSSPSSRGRSR